MRYKQRVALRSSLKDGLGWCLRYAQSLFGAPVAFDSAREAWDGQKGRHPGEGPPAGVQTLIWFDHTGTYGRPAVKKNWGHVCVALGDGRVLTSPLRSDQVNAQGVGSAIYPSILAMMRDLGGNPRYLGWSEYINGLAVVAPAPATTPAKPPTGQKEDEDMKVVGYIRDKALGSQGSVYALQENGKKRLIKKSEWTALRTLEGLGVKLAVASIAASDLKAIPDA